MLKLTRKEQLLVISLMLAFMVGMGIKHYRDKARMSHVAQAGSFHNHADH